MTPPIAILGAGPSGLTLGRLLELAGVDYVIFERDESEARSIERGGTLDLHAGSGQLALKQAGLMDKFKSIARYNTPTIIADHKGTVLISLSGEGEDDRPEIDRKDLRTILLDSIPSSRVRWASRVDHVEREAGGLMSVHLTSGHIESGFRLVVGADGAWSKARSLITSAKPQYSGLYYLTSIVRPDNPYHSELVSLIGQGNYMSFGKDQEIAAQVLGDGSYYTAVCLRLPKSWPSDNTSLLSDPPRLRSTLVQDYLSDWPENLTNIIKHSEGAFHAWPLYAMPTDSLNWSPVPGITLIGDAAHLSTPFVGEGVNCAMHDSLQLTEQIIKFGLDNLDQAVAAYESLMLPRGIDLISRSKTSGELLFAPDAPKAWLEAFASFIPSAESSSTPS